MFFDRLQHRIRILIGIPLNLLAFFGDLLTDQIHFLMHSQPLLLCFGQHLLANLAGFFPGPVYNAQFIRELEGFLVGGGQNLLSMLLGFPENSIALADNFLGRGEGRWQRCSNNLGLVSSSSSRRLSSPNTTNS
jgi:hypothetical protein